METPENIVDEICKIYDKIYSSKYPTKEPDIEKFVDGGKKLANAIKVAANIAAKGGDEAAAKKLIEEAFKIIAKEEAEVAAKIAAKGGGEAAAKKLVEEGFKIIAKEGAEAAKLAAKEGGEAAAKKLVEEGFKIFAKEGSEAAAKSLVEGFKIFAKEGVGAAAKLAAKEGTELTVKEGAKVFAKSATKKIPMISIGAGCLFGCIRVGFGIYHVVKGHKIQGAQEFVKAPLEVASGIAGSFPGLGTSISLAIDAGLCVWDVGYTVGSTLVQNTGSGEEEGSISIQLDAYLNKICEAIKSNTYTNENFLSDLLKIINKKLGSTSNDEKADEDTLYIYGMIEMVFDNGFFDKRFPTKRICEEMERQKFSQVQISTFRAHAISKKRY